VNGLLTTAIILAVEPSSFTIQFLEHQSQTEQDYCLDRCSNAGATIDQQGDRIFRILCCKRQQLVRVGYFLLCSHMRNMCRVISTTGNAEARASAYKDVFDPK